MLCSYYILPYLFSIIVIFLSFSFIFSQYLARLSFSSLLLLCRTDCVWAMACGFLWNVTLRVRLSARKQAEEEKGKGWLYSLWSRDDSDNDHHHFKDEDGVVLLLVVVCSLFTLLIRNVVVDMIMNFPGTSYFQEFHSVFSKSSLCSIIPIV